MADIELVVKIPEGLKKDFELEQWTALSCMEMKDALEKAVSLPKGHGRIIDESKITQATFETIEEDFTSMLHNTIKHRYMVFKGSDAPTIIEAESEDKK